MVTWISNYDCHSSALLHLVLSSDASICSTMAWLSLLWEILTMLLPQFPLPFCQTQKEMYRLVAQLTNILVLIEMVFTYYERISFNSVLLLLLNFVSRFRLELMYISLIENIRSSLTHLHGFQLLVLLPQFIEILFFICTNKINLLNLK